MITLKEVMVKAQVERYAIPAFNIHNLETLKGVCEVAAELRSPVLLAATPGTVSYAGAENLIALTQVARKKYQLPIFFHADHHEDLSAIKSLIDLGADSVMIDASFHDFDTNLTMSKEIVAYAKKHNVCVEAELGKLSGIEDELVVDEKDAYLTDPEQAKIFATQTGIDTLAVAIGTAHGVYKGEPKLDIDRLAQIQAQVDIPLVLHGASGIPVVTVQRTVELGICKVNVATELKIAFADALKVYLANNPEANDPRHYFKNSVAVMKEIVAQKIHMCGSHNRY